MRIWASKSTGNGQGYPGGDSELEIFRARCHRVWEASEFEIVTVLLRRFQSYGKCADFQRECLGHYVKHLEKYHKVERTSQKESESFGHTQESGEYSTSCLKVEIPWSLSFTYSFPYLVHVGGSEVRTVSCWVP